MGFIIFEGIRVWSIVFFIYNFKDFLNFKNLIYG